VFKAGGCLPVRRSQRFLLWTAAGETWGTVELPRKWARRVLAPRPGSRWDAGRVSWLPPVYTSPAFPFFTTAIEIWRCAARSLGMRPGATRAPSSQGQWGTAHSEQQRTHIECNQEDESQISPQRCPESKNTALYTEGEQKFARSDMDSFW